MKNHPLKTYGVAALIAQSLVVFACSSAAPAGAGGAAGTTTGQGGNVGGFAGGGGTGVTFPGSCTPGVMNPDYNVPPDGTGACAPNCQSVGCGLPCTMDCCVPCGIDAAGTKFCSCVTPQSPYTNCTCAPPPTFPAGLLGGACSPQGYAATTPPLTAPTGSISLKGIACTKINTVCFTAESTAASERGCICMSDGVMHCGSVNKWFTNSNAPATPYN